MSPAKLANRCCVAGHALMALCVGQEAEHVNMVSAHYEHVCFA